MLQDFKAKMMQIEQRTRKPPPSMTSIYSTNNNITHKMTNNYY